MQNHEHYVAGGAGFVIIHYAGKVGIQIIYNCAFYFANNKRRLSFDATISIVYMPCPQKVSLDITLKW